VKRILLLLTIALLMVALVVVTAGTTFGQPTTCHLPPQAIAKAGGGVQEAKSPVPVC
jgi:hypothetical protein